MKCAHVYTDVPKNRERDRVGKQCGAPAVNETTFCKFHGGASEQVINKARADRYEEQVRVEVDAAVRPVAPGGFTGLWDDDHPMLDPFSLLLWDIRRSGARIEWFDAKIEALEEERDIWWGITKREEIGASEFAGTNKTYEARENILVKMQNEERKRLQSLRDEWQNNRFEALKIAGYGAFRQSMREALLAVSAEFGIDMADPDTQERMKRALETLPEPIPAIEAPTNRERVGAR